MNDLNDDIQKIHIDNDTISEDETVSEEEKEPSLLKEILSNSLYLLAVLVITLLVVKYVGQRTVVVGHSMQDTLQDGDSLIVDKLSYRFKDPERFDVIVFPSKYENKEYLIKRIIGLPGEEIKIDYSGDIYINGKLITENYGRETILDPGLAWNSYVLMDDEYFVLGDNRNNSMDSRYFGPVKRNEIIGRAFIRIFPFNKFGNFDKK